MKLIKLVRRLPTVNVRLSMTKRPYIFRIKSSMPYHRLVSPIIIVTILTVAIQLFVLGLLATHINYRTPHILPQVQVDISLTLNYPPMIIHIDGDFERVGAGAIGTMEVVNTEEMVSEAVDEAVGRD